MSFVILLPFHKMIWDKANICGDGRDFVRHINLVGYAVSVADNCAVTVAGQQLPYCQLAGDMSIRLSCQIVTHEACFGSSKSRSRARTAASIAILDYLASRCSVMKATRASRMHSTRLMKENFSR